MTWMATLTQLLTPSAAHGFPPRSERRGLLPRGAIQPGSCSDETLKFLQARAGQRLSLGRICMGIPRDPKRISWSLDHLRARGYIYSQAGVGGRCVWWAPTLEEIVQADAKALDQAADGEAIPPTVETMTARIAATSTEGV